MNDLVSYITAALIAWTPATKERPADVVAQRVATVAEDIAAVVQDEPPLWASRFKTALVLASIAHHESDLEDWVQDGRCNDAAWRLDHLELVRRRGSCDGGHAYGLWQEHVWPAALLLPNSGWRLLRAPEPGAITPEDVLADSRLSARVALHMVRQSVQTGQGLCGYTGETERPCPKGELRLHDAVQWYRTHP